MQAGMESCLTKSIMAGGMGFALGGAFGLFMSSVRLHCPYVHLRTIYPVAPNALQENQPLVSSILYGADI
jgi:hypothetical protein